MVTALMRQPSPGGRPRLHSAMWDREGTPDIDAALDAIVAAAPPLPYETRARLAWLLRGPQHQPRRDTAA